MLGVVLFTIVLAVWPVANRLRESEALVRRQEIDLANLAQLSQYIVQHLRESILVVDTEDRVRLINESAAQILGDSNAYPGALLGEASPRLLYLLETWRQNTNAPTDATHTFVAEDGARIIRPHFAALGGRDPAPMLVFLEDTSLIAEQVQQSKLAALGRLSASIAHEIRNPVGAMSHAAQLLAESAQLSGEDKRLTEIIRGNADRVSAIINNVLQLSKRSETRLERLSLSLWLSEFCEEFCETMQLDTEPPARRGAARGNRSARRSDAAAPGDVEPVRQRLAARAQGQRNRGDRDSLRPAESRRTSVPRSRRSRAGRQDRARRADIRALLQWR